jgi:hypothetical protein
MAGIVYILCALTSLLCAVLLYRAYSRSKLRFLFWCSFGFWGFTFNNVLLFIDLIIFPEINYIINIRTLPAVFGMVVMIYGLIMEEV